MTSGPESQEDSANAPAKPLRRGWTTGACATAAAKAAFEALLTGHFPDPVEIVLPKGQRPSFALAKSELRDNEAMAGIIKDAGDDPDVTHLALVQATVRRLPEGSGVQFRAGPGVGTVTRPGLPIPPGEPAINPVPRQMMRDAIAEVAARCGATPDVEITISIPNGAEIAKQTWNPRLGIEGGLSILGTTGIVNPYSCSAWIASIHRGIDVIRAAGLAHAAACTGSTSEAAVARHYALPDFAYIDMGDFAGGVLKYLRHHPIPRLTLAGGFGKISKLAEGALDLHSGRSQVSLDGLASGAAALGANDATVAAIRAANTAMEALAIARRAGLALGDWVAAKARDVAEAEADGQVDVELLIIDRAGETVGHAGFDA
ncbi:cobalt-precorrin-5B (C(1))-methyltransferase [Dongia sedimenti]|uniref:Cobalt-precorrin-5B C(1)-methyltransferase n=1 Tax=Dongia sedimenti TaxID=3064282 RepID=A0ABU0YU33_9PROT|nr:cobalt-precorrin-5B (C(1))-methyltransferase [Rhodospirillaceae bacterium R-7]